MEVSHRLDRLKPSPTLALNQKAKALQAQGKSVINLTAGEPDLPTPQRICRAAEQAIERGETRYTASSGIAELKQAIIEATQKTYGRGYKKNEVIVTCGAKQALSNLCLTLLNDGDEAIMIAPFWVSYADMVLLTGAKPVVVDTTEANQFSPDLSQLEKAITAKTKVVFLNSPSNPTGAIYSKTLLGEIAGLIKKFPQITVITDDIYEKFIFDGETFASIAMISDFPSNQLVVVNGVSKSYAMTGWRIGYAIGPEKLIASMDIIQSNTTSNATSVAQWAAVEALNGDQSDVRKMKELFESRRNRACTSLSKIPQVTLTKPKGAFYLFPNFRAYLGSATSTKMKIANDIQLATFLLDECGVATVPGSAFGMDGYLRLSYAVSDRDLDEGIARIQKGLQTLTR